LVIATVARARALVDSGNILGAHAELSRGISAYPFLIEPLHFLIRLCLEVGDYQGAMQTLAWLEPALSEDEIVECRTLVTRCHQAHKETFTGSTNVEGVENTAVLRHLASLLHGDSAAGRETTDSDAAHPRSWIIWITVTAILVLLAWGTFSTIGVQKERRSRMDTEQRLVFANAQLQATQAKVDTLTSKATWPSRDTSEPDKTAKPEHRVFVDEDGIVDRIMSLGPNFGYSMLGLGDVNSPDRAMAMSTFVDLYPDSPIYTGYFLRELHDLEFEADPVQAHIWAERISVYVKHYPDLSDLMSSNVKETLSEVNVDD